MQRSLLVAAGLVLVGLFGFGIYGSSRSAAELTREADPSRSPWVWKLNSVPPSPEQKDVVVILRVREDPPEYRAGDVEPLSPTEGSDRRTGATCPADVAGRVSVKLVDLRDFGAAGLDNPLRLSVAVGAAEPGSGIAMKLDGHSFNGPPIHHGASWSNGELPLMTLRTVGQDRLYTTTILLVSRQRLD